MKTKNLILLVLIVSLSSFSLAQAPNWEEIVLSQFDKTGGLSNAQVRELIPVVMGIASYLSETRNLTGPELDKVTAEFLSGLAVEEVKIIHKMIERRAQNHDLIRTLEGQTSLAIYSIELIKKRKSWTEKFDAVKSLEKDIGEAYKSRNMLFFKEVEELIAMLPADTNAVK